MIILNSMLFSLVFLWYELLFSVNNYENTVYGIIFYRFIHQINIYCYKGILSENVSNTIDSIEFSLHTCNNRNNDLALNFGYCLSKAKDICDMLHLDNNNIMIKIVHSPNYKYLYPADVLETFTRPLIYHLKDYYSHYSISPDESILLLDNLKLGLYYFLEKSFHIENDKKEETPILAYSGDLFVMGYIVNTIRNVNSPFVFNLNYRNKYYSIFSNNFLCNAPRNLYFLIIKKSIEAVDLNVMSNNETVTNVCIPTGEKLLINHNSLNSVCLFDYKLKKGITMIGNFDVDACTTMIRSLLYDKSFCNFIDYCNLAGFESLLFPLNITHLRLFNGIFYVRNLSLYDFLKDINKKLTYCYDKHDIYSMKYNKFEAFCIILIVMREIFTKAQYYNKKLLINAFIIESNMFPIQSLLFSDPRFAIKKIFHKNITILENYAKHDIMHTNISIKNPINPSPTKDLSRKILTKREIFVMCLLLVVFLVLAVCSLVFIWWNKRKFNNHKQTS